MHQRSVVMLAFLLAGCFDNVETPFPPGLEPLEENQAPPPAPIEGDPYPEELSMVRRLAPDSSDRTPSVHARAYVRAPVARVWEALRNPDVNADRRVFTSWEAREAGEPEYDYAYVLRSVIVNVVTVEYDVTWRHGVVIGTLDAPELVSIRYQKTWGSTAIQDLRGSILLRAVEPGVTELSVVEYLRATAASHANIESFFRDMVAETLALSHGEPLPPISEL